MTHRFLLPPAHTDIAERTEGEGGGDSFNMFAALSAIVSLMGSHEAGEGNIIYNWLWRHLDILHAGAALQFGSAIPLRQ